MNVVATAIPDVLLIEPKVFGDERGFFYESYNRRTLRDAIGLDLEFVQDNHSMSERNVLRGLHYQLRRPQGKLVRVISGEVFDVAVDLRRESSTFRKWVGFPLSAASRRMAWIPPGFAHGFVVTSERAEFVYKVSEYYSPDDERTIRWDDPELRIAWPIVGAPILARKDIAGAYLGNAELE